MLLRELPSSVYNGGYFCEGETTLSALHLFETLLSAELPVSEQVSLLKALNDEPITGALLEGAVLAVQKKAKIHMLELMEVLDIVGTGGDGKGLFNVSTTAAFILGGAGVPIMKHGNVAVSSRSGGIDLLKALGVHLPKDAKGVFRDFEATGMAFIFAQYFYPFWGQFKEARFTLAEQGKKTLFNYLGPLANPFNPRYQAIGVVDPSVMPAFAEALLLLGRQGMIFHSEGADELLLGPHNQVLQVRRGQVLEYQISLSDLGMKPAPVSTLQGGSPEENALITRAILSGKETGPKRDVALLNAAIAQVAYQPSLTLPEALEKAERSISSGMALRKLERLCGTVE